MFEYDSDNGSDEWASADEGKFPVGEEDDSCPPSPIVFEDEHCDENSLLPVQTATRVDLDFNEDQRDVITRQSVPQAIFEVALFSLSRLLKRVVHDFCPFKLRNNFLHNCH